jgi:hypothetical protein
MRSSSEFENDSKSLVLAAPGQIGAFSEELSIGDRVANSFAAREALVERADFKHQVEAGALNAQQQVVEENGFIREEIKISHIKQVVDNPFTFENKVAYTGFAVANLIENKDNIAYLYNQLPSFANPQTLVDLPAQDSFFSQSFWGTAHLGASILASYANPVGNFASNAAITTGAYMASQYLNYKYSDSNIVNQITIHALSKIITTGALMAVSGATLGTGAILLPVGLSVAGDLLQYYSKGSDISGSSTIVDSMVPVAGGLLSAYLIASKGPSLSFEDADSLSINFNKIMLASGAVAGIAKGHQLTKLIWDNMPSVPEVNKYLPKCEDIKHMMQDFSSEAYNQLSSVAKSLYDMMPEVPGLSVSNDYAVNLMGGNIHSNNSEMTDTCSII